MENKLRKILRYEIRVCGVSENLVKGLDFWLNIGLLEVEGWNRSPEVLETFPEEVKLYRKNQRKLLENYWKSDFLEKVNESYQEIKLTGSNFQE